MEPGVASNPGAAPSRPISEIKADLFKALGHPARVQILEVLSAGGRSVGDIQPAVGIEASHLSQQLAVLRRAGLVTSRKQGATVVYALRDPLIADMLTVARQLLIHTLSQTRDLLNDLTEPAVGPPRGPVAKKGRGATGA